MSWDEYWEERIDRVKRNTPMAELLEDYNIPVRREETEVQFPCPLHGDGKDKRFSARFYPDTNSTYCWACKEARDPIAWVQDYERRIKGRDMEFSETLQKLEQKFDIQPPSPPTDAPEERRERDDDEASKEFRELQKILGGDDTPAEPETRVERSFEETEDAIRILVEKARNFDQLMDPVLKLAYLLDNLRWDVRKEDIGADEALETSEKIRSKIEALGSKVDGA